MASLSDLLITVGFDVSALQAGIDAASSELKGFDALTEAATSAAIAAFAGMGQAFRGTASDIQQSSGGIKNSLGSIDELELKNILQELAGLKGAVSVTDDSFSTLGSTADETGDSVSNLSGDASGLTSSFGSLSGAAATVSDGISKIGSGADSAGASLSTMGDTASSAFSQVSDLANSTASAVGGIGSKIAEGIATAIGSTIGGLIAGELVKSGALDALTAWAGSTIASVQAYFSSAAAAAGAAAVATAEGEAAVSYAGMATVIETSSAEAGLAAEALALDVEASSLSIAASSAAAAASVEASSAGSAVASIAASAEITGGMEAVGVAAAEAGAGVSGLWAVIGGAGAIAGGVAAGVAALGAAALGVAAIGTAGLAAAGGMYALASATNDAVAAWSLLAAQQKTTFEDAATFAGAGQSLGVGDLLTTLFGAGQLKTTVDQMNTLALLVDNIGTAVRTAIANTQGQGGVAEIVSAFQNLADPVDRATLAVQLFGTNAAAALKLMNSATVEAVKSAGQVASGLDEATRESLDRVSGYLANLKSMVGLDNTWAQFWGDFKNLALSALTTAEIPVHGWLQTLGSELQTWVDHTNEWLASHPIQFTSSLDAGLLQKLQNFVDNFQLKNIVPNSPAGVQGSGEGPGTIGGTGGVRGGLNNSSGETGTVLLTQAQINALNAAAWAKYNTLTAWLIDGDTTGTPAGMEPLPGPGMLGINQTIQPGTVNTPAMFAPGTELTPEQFDDQQAMLGDLDKLNMSILGHVLNVQGAWDEVSTSLADIGQLEYEAETAALLYQQELDRVDAQWNLVSVTALTAIGQIEDALSKDLATGLVDVIDGTKKVGQAFETMAEQLAKTVLTTIIQGALTPLLDAFDGLITKIPIVNNLLNFGTLTNPNPTGNQITGPLGHGTPNPNAPADPGLPPNTAAVNADSTAIGANTAGIGVNTTAEGLNTAALIALTAVMGASLLKSLLTKGISSVTSTVTPTDVDPSASDPNDGGAGSGSQSGASNLGTEALLALGAAMDVNTKAIIANSAAIAAETVSNEANIAMGNVINGTFGQLPPALKDVVNSNFDLSDKYDSLDKSLDDATTAVDTLPPALQATDTSLDSISKGLGSLPGLPGSGFGNGLGGLGSGSGEVGQEGSDLLGDGSLLDNSSGEVGDAVSGASGIGSAIGGIVSGLSGIVGIVGVAVSAISGAVTGDELAQLNNKTWLIVSSSQGILNQVIASQGTYNQYLPELVHLVDIWGALLTLDQDLHEIITAQMQVDQDLRVLVQGGNGSSSGLIQPPNQVTSDVSDNSAATRENTLSTSSLKTPIESLGASIKQNLINEANMAAALALLPNALQLASSAGSSGITGAASAAAVAQLLQQLPTGGQAVAPSFATSVSGGAALTPAQAQAMLGGFMQTQIQPVASPPAAASNYGVTDPGFQATRYEPVNMNPSAIYAPSLAPLVGQNTPGTVNNYNNTFTLSAADNTSRSMANGLITALRQRGMSIR